MDWIAAVEAMRAGEHVQRTSESWRNLLGESGGVPIYECGTEPCFLAAAWTEHDTPTRVFCGSESKCLFVPGHDDTSATDWVIV